MFHCIRITYVHVSIALHCVLMAWRTTRRSHVMLRAALRWHDERTCTHAHAHAHTRARKNAHTRMRTERQRGDRLPRILRALRPVEVPQAGVGVPTHTLDMAG